MPAPPKIAVVGASARAAAFSLLRAGCEVVAADLFADADLARACKVTRITDYPEGLADWLAATPCDGWLYTGALENHPDLVDRMAKLRPLCGIKGDVLRKVRDPMWLHENLGRTWDEVLPEVIEHLDVLRSLPGNVGDLTALQQAWEKSRFNFPETKPCDGTHPGEGDWLHKTGHGGNGSGVRPFDPQSNVFTTEGYWQRYIPGMPGSAIYLGDGINTCTLLGVTRQLIGVDLNPPPQYSGEASIDLSSGEGPLNPGNGHFQIGAEKPSPSPSQSTGRGIIKDFQYCGTLAPWNLALPAMADLTRLGRVLSTQYSLRGIFGIDFIYDGEHVWLIEVNPRVTAAVEVVERITGNNLLAEHLAAFKFHSDPFRQVASPAAGKVILYAKQPITVSRVLSEKLLANAGPRHSPQLADIPNPDTSIAVGEPILTVLADGTNIATVERELRERVAALECELYRG
jgi:predicted ATP-grasp superfamily ATP-dependent carboligase